MQHVCLFTLSPVVQYLVGKSQPFRWPANCSEKSWRSHRSSVIHQNSWLCIHVFRIQLQSKHQGDTPLHHGVSEGNVEAGVFCRISPNWLEVESSRWKKRLGWAGLTDDQLFWDRWYHWWWSRSLQMFAYFSPLFGERWTRLSIGLQPRPSSLYSNFLSDFLLLQILQSMFYLRDKLMWFNFWDALIAYQRDESEFDSCINVCFQMSNLELDSDTWSSLVCIYIYMFHVYTPQSISPHVLLMLSSSRWRMERDVPQESPWCFNCFFVFANVCREKNRFLLLQ